MYMKILGIYIVQNTAILIFRRFFVLEFTVLFQLFIFNETLLSLHLSACLRLMDYRETLYFYI